MLICKQCQGELLRISDWEADEILGRTHIHNEKSYICNYLKCSQCNKLHIIRYKIIKIEEM